MHDQELDLGTGHALILEMLQAPTSSKRSPTEFSLEHQRNGCFHNDPHTIMQPKAEASS